MNNYHVIIPCAGHGSRFGSEIPKQYHSLAGLTVLDWTIQAFIAVNLITSITVVYSSYDTNIVQYVEKYPQVRFIDQGGSTRAESVINGLKSLEVGADDWVLVHDAARCCIDPHDIQNLISTITSTEDSVGGILAAVATDTIKLVDNQLNIRQTIDRNSIYLAQTPQMFRKQTLLSALEFSDLTLVTDEASAVELHGAIVSVIKAKYPNFKITYPQDLLFAECILSQRNSRN